MILYGSFHPFLAIPEMGGGGGTISLNMGPISLGIWGLVGGAISLMIWASLAPCHQGNGAGGGGGGGTISLLHSSELPQVI